MRRTRLQTTLATALGAAMLAGCGADGGADPEPTGSATPTAAAVSSPSVATPTPTTNSPAPDSGEVIPGSALLQPEDLGGAKLEPVPGGDSTHLRPARPCDERYPSDRTRTAAVAMRAYVTPGAGWTPQVVLQYVGLHPGHAEAAFEEIVAAVRRCPGSLDSGERRWQVAASDVAGDESLLVRVSERISYGDQETVVTTPAVIVRVGEHVMVIADLGWENASGDEAHARRLAEKAAERLRADA